MTLDADECVRAERFRTGTLRTRFIVGRAALRAILSGYLGIEPEAVSFTYGAHGKPALAGDPSGLEFNLAHTGDLALCGLTLGRAIGVNVETIRQLDDASKIIGRFFSAREQAEFLTLPEADRLPAFYRGWAA